MLENLMEAGPAALVVLDQEDTVQGANRAALDLFGCALGGLLGQALDVLLPGCLAARDLPLEGTSHNAGHPRQARRLGLLARHKDGGELPVDVTFTPFLMGTRELVAAAIQARSGAEEGGAPDARGSERLRRLMELARIGAWEVDIPTGTRTYSPEILAMLGVTEPHANQDHFLQCVHEEDRALVAASFSRAVALGTGFQIVLRMRRGNGTWGWFESRAAVDLEPGGRPQRIRGLVQDITTQRAVEQELRQQQQLYRAVLETSPDVALIVDEEGTVAFASRTFSGAPAAALVGRSTEAFLGAAGHAAFLGALAWASKHQTVVHNDTVLVGMDGRKRHVRHRIRTLPTGTAPAEFLVMATDISEEREANAMLADLRRAMENAVEGVARVGANGRIQAANAALEQAHGRGHGELVGVEWKELFSQDAHTKVEAAHQQMHAKGKSAVECLGRRQDGTFFHKRITMVQARNSDGDPAGHHCFTQDISEQHRMRDQLLTSDRMASVGMLAAGVAHEINNPLASVIGNLELAVSELATLQTYVPTHALEELRAELADARDAAERVRQIVKDLRIFSRHEEQKPQPINVEKVLESSLRMAWNELRHRALLVKQFGNVPLVDGSEARLAQVFLNLLVNAAQAIPEGAAQDHVVRVATLVTADGMVCIEVEDSGAGMTAEVRSQLFTPFFTTKPVGQGTGLGLAICHRIVTGMGGQLLVETAPERGTVFKVLLLPCNTVVAPATAAPVPAPVGQEPLRRARVLVVDDDASVRTAISRILRGSHEVEMAAGGRVALERISGGARFDVIFCDLMMPDMTGMDLHAALADALPDQASRMVFVTGGAFTARARAFLDAVPNSRMEKPFNAAGIRNRVRQQMG